MRGTHADDRHARDGLNIRFNHTPSMAVKLEHVPYDTFRRRWTDRSIEDAYVTFALNPELDRKNDDEGDFAVGGFQL
jgi:hypothetical protein